MSDDTLRAALDDWHPASHGWTFDKCPHLKCADLRAALAASATDEPRSAEDLRKRIRGLSLPAGPDFAWVDGHAPFIEAALAAIDEWDAASATDEGLDPDRLTAIYNRGFAVGQHLAASATEEQDGWTVCPAVPETLNVERLMVAIFEAERPGDYPTWADYIGAFGSAGTPPWRRKAERLAREYAALAASATDEPT